MNDIQSIETWLATTSAQIRSLCNQLKEMGVTEITISGESTYIHGEDECGPWIKSRINMEGYDGIFESSKFYPNAWM